MGDNKAITVFQKIKKRLVKALVLWLTEFEIFEVYYDASYIGFGASLCLKRTSISFLQREA